MSRKVKDVVDWCGGPDRSGGGGTFSFSLCSFSAPTPSEAALGLPGAHTHTRPSATMARNSLLLFSLFSCSLSLFFSRRVGWLSRLPTLTLSAAGGPVCAATLALTFHGRELEQRPRPRDRPGSRRLSRMQRRHIARPRARAPPHALVAAAAARRPERTQLCNRHSPMIFPGESLFLAQLMIFFKNKFFSYHSKILHLQANQCEIVYNNDFYGKKMPQFISFRYQVIFFVIFGYLSVSPTLKVNETDARSRSQLKKDRFFL